jgi:L-threonylcarbamoyladenylate synthase
MKTIQLSKNNQNFVLKECKKTIQNKGMVVFPSDTVYGLAVNAKSQTAVNKLFNFKDRPVNKSISVIVKDIAALQNIVKTTPSQVKIVQTLLPGPFTIALPSRNKLAKGLEAENNTLGVRIPNNRFTQALSKSLDCPFTATSANIHLKGPHYSISAFLKTLSNKKRKMIDLIVDQGKLPHNPPSTVLDMSETTLSTLRKGSLNVEKIIEKTTVSESQTKNLAKKLFDMLLVSAHRKSLVFILIGNLGSGKTVFAKGLGNSLGISNIVSPTYVTYYEYHPKNTVIKKFHHLDLYNVDNYVDLGVLKIETLVKENEVLVIEWGERLGPVLEKIKNSNSELLLIYLNETSPSKRLIEVYKVSR